MRITTISQKGWEFVLTIPTLIEVLTGRIRRAPHLALIIPVIA